jgi:hypothetical protein
MFQFFQTLPYRLTGVNPEVLHNYDANSRNKVTLLGILILIPAIIWFFNGFLLTYKIMEVNVFIALITGSILFMLILVIERAIVLSTDVKWFVATMRFFLALVLSVLGSMVMDVCVFGKDIDYRLTALAHRDLESKVQNSYQVMEGKATNVHNEVHGKGVTRIKGFAKAAQNLQNQYIDSKNDYVLQKSEFQKFKEIIKHPEHPEYEATMTNLGYNSYLKRIHVLHEMINEDSLMTLTFWLFLLLGLFMELLPLLIKIGTNKSAYELDVEAQAELLCARRLRVLEQNRLYHKQSEAQKKVSGLLHNRNSFNTIL